MRCLILTSLVVGCLLAQSGSMEAAVLSDTTALETEADAYYQNRQYDSAKMKFEEALSQLQVAQDTVGIIRSAIGRSNALLRLREYDEALAALTDELPFSPDKIEDDFMRSQWYKSIANVHYYKYDAFSALENYQYYYTFIIDNSPESQEHLQASRVMTIYYLNAGLMTTALEYAAEFKELADKVDGKISEASADASNFLGMLSRYTGEPKVALFHYEQALIIAEALITQGSWVPSNILQSNIGMLYMNELQDPEMALNYFRQSKAFLQEHGGNPYDRGQIEGKFALYFADKQNYDSAHARLDRNIALLHQAERTEMEIYNKLSVRARFFQAEGRYDDALAQLDKATEYRYSAIPGNTTFNWATDYQKGLAWLALNRPDSALHYFHSALDSYLPDVDVGPNAVPEYADRSPEKLMITKILLGKARAYEALGERGLDGQFELAFNHYQGLLEWLNQIRSSFVYGESKVFISQNMQEILDEAISLAHSLYDQTGDQRFISFIHHTIESNKWVTLKEELLTSQARIPGSFEMTRRIEFLRKRIGFINQQLAENDFSIADSAELVQKRLDMEKEIVQVKRGQSWLTDNSVKPLSDVQSLLGPQELLSEFLLGKSNLHQLLVTRDTVQYLAHDDPAERAKEVNTLRENIRKSQAKPYAQTAYALYKRYVAPAERLTKTGITRQVVIPDAFINNLPFDALLTTEIDAEGEFPASGYLIQKVNTRKHFTVAGITPSQEAGVRQGNVLAFSPNFTQENIRTVNERAAESMINLPYAVEECQSLTALFGGDFYRGEAATETSFKKASGQASIIHLATHAIMEEGLPDRSRLLLFADSLNDGMLHSYEINALDIKSDLVALSACNTGIGEYRTGEGNMSLARGFYLAGTRSVLMSLWTVDDHSTAGLMKGFYAYLDQGLSKDEALQKAKLDMIREADNIHRNPYYWAGFDLVGDVSPVSDSRPKWLIWAIAAGVLLVIGFFWQRRRFSQG